MNAVLNRCFCFFNLLYINHQHFLETVQLHVFFSSSHLSTHQYFLEMMQVPRVESKLRVFSFKIHFSSQVLWYLQLFIFILFLVLKIYKNFFGVSVLFYSIYLFLTSFADSRVQKKPKHCKLFLSRGLLIVLISTFLQSFDICKL